MKKTIKALIITISVVLGMTIGIGTERIKNIDTNKVSVLRIVTESEEGLYLEEGQDYLELTDGSWAIYGNGEFIFQPVGLGDWDYNLNSEDELRRIIETYISIKNEKSF